MARKRVQGEKPIKSDTGEGVGQPPPDPVDPMALQEVIPSGKPPGRGKRQTALSSTSQWGDPLWQTIDEAVGGRDGFLSAALASTNPKAGALAEMLLDSAYAKHGTKALAKKAGLTVPEIVDMYRDRKWLESVIAVHEQLPDILRDAATDAKAALVPCSACRATGLDEKGAECFICRGIKLVRKPGDKDKLKFVGEAAGLVGKTGPAVEVNNQTVINQQSNSVSFEDLMRKAALQTSRPQIITVTREDGS
jgi:hypothetical protein